MLKLKFILPIIITILLFVAYGIYNITTENRDEIKIVEPVNIKEEIIIEEIYVDIKGEVNTPGVYKVKENNIISEVIELAGGLTINAYTDNINLSKKVENEMVIVVQSIEDIKEEEDALPIINSTSDETINNTNDEPVDNVNKIININTASINELITLNGIGESKANAIVEYRLNNGLFKNISEIMNVSGIGESTFDKIKNFITI